MRCGYTHTVALTDSNEVFSFGSDGLKRVFISYFVVPRRIEALRYVNVVQMAAGASYTLFLNAHGTVFACGVNEVGQLGLGDTERRITPVVVTSLLDHFVVKVRTELALSTLGAPQCGSRCALQPLRVRFELPAHVVPCCRLQGLCVHEVQRGVHKGGPRVSVGRRQAGAFRSSFKHRTFN